MYELEQEIQAWKNGVSRLESMRSHNVEELEQHLRDSIAELQSAGLRENEAFLIATTRVGEPEALGQEFGKVNGGHVWAQRMFWMLSGFLFFEIVQFAISAMASLAQLLATFVGGDGAAIGAASVGMTLLCWLALAVWLRHGATHRSDNYSLTRVLLTYRGKAICGGVAAILLVATLAKFGSQISLYKITAIEEIGVAAMIMAWANASLSVLLPLILLVIWLSIRKRAQGGIIVEA